MAEMVTALFLVWLAVEAVYQENAFELLASAVVASCIGARIIYFIVSNPRQIMLETQQHTLLQQFVVL